MDKKHCSFLQIPIKVQVDLLYLHRLDRWCGHYKLYSYRLVCINYYVLSKFQYSQFYSFLGQNISLRQSNIPQVVQLPSVQQTIPVQVPISSNGQTLYQTVHLPLQSFASSLPNIIQANQGQLMQIPQLTQMTQTPQMAQIVNSNGQIQTVQLTSPISNGQQIQIVNTSSTNNQFQNANTPATSPNVMHVSSFYCFVFIAIEIFYSTKNLYSDKFIS